MLMTPTSHKILYLLLQLKNTLFKQSLLFYDILQNKIDCISDLKEHSLQKNQKIELYYLPYRISSLFHQP